MSDQTEAKGRARFPDLTLADLVGELLWPGLLRAGKLAFRPQRVLMGACTIVVVGLVGSLSRLWSGGSFGERSGEVFGGAALGLGGALDRVSLSRFWDLPLGRLWVALEALLLHAPVTLVREYPVSTFALGLPMVGVALVGWFAIARSAAWEFGVHACEPWTVCVARGIERLPALAIGLFGVPIAAALVVGVTAGLGWLLLTLPVVNVIGGVLWGLALLVGVLTALLLAVWAAGLPMLAPAVACEGPDAFDAVQRSLAYVIGRPLRYLVYCSLLMALGVVLATLAGLVLAAGDGLATRSTGLLLSAEHTLIVVPDAGGSALPGGTGALAAEVIGFWRSLLSLALGSFVLSYFGSASSVLYLLMRRLNDGQDAGDLASEIGPGR